MWCPRLILNMPNMFSSQNKYRGSVLSRPGGLESATSFLLLMQSSYLPCASELHAAILITHCGDVNNYFSLCFCFMFHEPSVLLC
ncbi:hypothetical protein C0J52_16689 [Blattella germanica]|nr:hypothetical protein C0J52_16689 [Blattella germanica]